MADKNRRKIYEFTNGRCYYCGCKLDFGRFHIDHFSPRFKGGKDSGNMVPSCADCNLIKSDMTIEEFREKIGSYLFKDIHARIVAKYFGINLKPIRFLF